VATNPVGSIDQERVLAELARIHGELNPLPEAELNRLESTHGVAIPSFLRRVANTVADGDLGYEVDLLSIQACLQERARLRAPDPADSTWAWPDRLLPISDLGCGMLICQSLDSQAVVLFDPNPHTPGEPWSNCFTTLKRTLPGLLTAWMREEDLLSTLEAADTEP
jgi:hypothetical protein